MQDSPGAGGRGHPGRTLGSLHIDDTPDPDEIVEIFTSATRNVPSASGHTRPDSRKLPESFHRTASAGHTGRHRSSRIGGRSDDQNDVRGQAAPL